MDNPMKRVGGQAVRRLGRAFSGEFVWPQPSTITRLRERAVERSAAMIEERLEGASLSESREGFLRFVAGLLPSAPDGLFLEFGYHVGASARILTQGLRRRPERPVLHSFDAFEGLRDQWTEVDLSVGSLAMGGTVPDPVPGVELVVGWVEETLVPFLDGHPGPVALCNLDMDVYPPTRFALEALAPRFVDGSLVVFDDLHGYPGWELASWRALHEVLDGTPYRWVAFGPHQGALTIGA